MYNKDKRRFDDQCMPAFDLMQEVRLRWTRDRSRVNFEEFVHCQVRVNVTYSEAKLQISARNGEVFLRMSSLFKSGGPLPSLRCSA